MTPSATAAPCHLPHGGRHRGSIPTKRRTSPKGAKYRHGRNACLQEHSDDAAHEPHRGEVPTWEECLLAGAFRRCGARAPSGRSTGGAPPPPSFRPTRGEMPACRSISTKRRTSPIGAKQRSEGSPAPLLARGSLHFTTFRVRDDAGGKDAPVPYPLLLLSADFRRQ